MTSGEGTSKTETKGKGVEAQGSADRWLENRVVSGGAQGGARGGQHGWNRMGQGGVLKVKA